MKRFLSIFLAVTMILAMMPTTFAAVDAANAVTYNFYVGGHADLTSDKAYLTLEASDGAKSFTDYGIERNWAYLGSKLTGEANSGTHAVLDIAGYLRTGRNAQNNWVAFKIKVPKTATYSVSGSAYYYNNASGTMQMYIAPFEGELAQKFASADTYGAAGLAFGDLGISSNDLVGSVNLRNSTYATQTITIPSETITTNNGIFKDFDLSADKEYALVINQGNASRTGALTLKSLTLTPNIVTVEPTISVSAAPEEIVVGETAALSSVVTDSTEADVSASTVVTYTSESDCIAISGNIVTGVKEGTATITASATVDGKPVTDTIEIKVKSDVLILDFNTASEVTSLEDPNGTKNPVYTAYGDRSWAYLGTNISGGGHETLGFIYLQANAYLATPNLEENEWIAFKVKAPKTAMYTISGEAHHYHNATTAMDMYIIPVSDFNPDYGNATGGVRTEATTFEDLALDNEKKIGSANIKVSRNDRVTKTIALTEPNAQLMRANQEYVLLLNASTGGAMTVTELALTPLSQEIPKEPVIVAEEISFVATSNVGEKDMMVVEAEGFEYDEFMDSIPSGTFVKVTAPKKEGYEFKHWVRGSADNGVYISDEPSYSFTALTNTFITAIYENVTDEDDTAVVEFYNGNGQYLAKAISTLGGTVTVPEAAVAPTLTGFEFADQWKTEDGVLDVTTPLVKKLTRAVAQFKALSTVFNVTCGNDKTPLSYGEKKTFTSDDNVYWLRDNTIVGYGKSYTYAAWAETEITMAESGKLCPVVLLDDTIKDGARMIEYNAAGKDIVEVGILFGGQNVNIGSCNSKATSQYKNQHGQFTAKPYGTETHARGYMIYKDTDNSYKVVYSD